MRGVERTVLIPWPAATYDQPDEPAPVAHVREADHDCRVGAQQFRRSGEGRPRIDQMLKDISRDEAVERGFRTIRAPEEGLDVRLNDAVEVVCGVGRVVGIHLNSDDGHVPATSEGRTQPTARAAEVQHLPTRFWHMGDDVLAGALVSVGTVHAQLLGIR